MLGIPVSSTFQSAVKQVAISSGQILVTKGNPCVSKVMGGKQVLAQGVAKAIVSGASSISGPQAAAKVAGGSSGKSGGQSSHARRTGSCDGTRICTIMITTIFNWMCIFYVFVC